MGRLIGFVVRLFEIVFGLIFVLLLFVLSGFVTLGLDTTPRGANILF